MTTHILKIISLAYVIIGLSGCFYVPTRRTQKIIEVHDTPPNGCLLLGEVQGRSAYPLLAVGLEVAKSKAKSQAADLGATHVFWSDMDSNLRSQVFGRAYRCVYE